MQGGDFSAPVTVSAVRFEGISATKDGLLSRHAAPLFALPRDTPFGHVAAPSPRGRRETAPARRVAVVFHVKEVSRLYAKTGTEIGNNEGNMFANLKIRNALGNAETLEATVNYGVETSEPLTENKPFQSQLGSSFSVLFSKPYDADPNKLILLNAFKQSKGHNLYSSYSEQNSGLSAKFKTLDTYVGAIHEMGYESTWRRLFDLGSVASMTIRKDAGHSLKSALTYLGTLDRRDDNLLPTRGYYIKTHLEAAGLGGDVRHIKTESEAQVHIPIADSGFSFSSSLRSGLLYPLFGTATRVNDRFLLGGSGNVRGFTHNGIGPKDGNDVVGGDFFLAGGLSLFTPLPWLREYPIKGHLFANAGNLVKLDDAKDLSVASKKLLSGFSSAVGLVLQLEINYCLPISVTSTDGVKPGLQFGAGLHFA
ncbi:hypothetical protein BCR33DRAFT_712495 [Rhizoclosmatium globosum]|uniref:Bacterial surface antigen (D15) domain-containing protein n=1 Tax=Rhizoclosmatium globosum TaxID=329046 RepID=A0A1Y2CX80_9FUNG|nr:hypothetical protein BCR33DRAFT_712495 [Rhizoclosmatium globosum]|eukprot:ORY51444.1 hypothetical protein BCR33DRAFT_712495 [Rhizoclosmatium globosum]